MFFKVRLQLSWGITDISVALTAGIKVIILELIVSEVAKVRLVAC